mmetsp:Transcript_110137/g.322230  ORF Transcript_110137/g.322230 Transcript_110137/m.322230 type:complete len:279 (-) Transcript_110137:1671-2507(-)
MPVCRISQHRLQIVHSLLQARMVSLQLDLVIGKAGVRLLEVTEVRPVALARTHTSHQLIKLRMGGVQCLAMLVGRVSNDALNVFHALLHARVVHVEGRLVSREAAMRLLEVGKSAAILLAGRDASVHSLQLGVGSRELHGVLVGRLAHRLLQVAQPVCQRRVLRTGRPQIPHVLNMLRMARLEALQFLCMLSGRIPQLRLEVVDPLLQGGVARGLRRALAGEVGVRLLEVADGSGVLLVGREAAVQLIQLGVSRLQVLRVLVGGVSQRALQILHPLLQ